MKFVVGTPVGEYRAEARPAITIRRLSLGGTTVKATAALTLDVAILYEDGQNREDELWRFEDGKLTFVLPITRIEEGA